MWMTRGMALPLIGLVTVALALGVWLGVGARLPTETEIIEAAAADYVAETGGEMTDCAARPSRLEYVRLVVTCERGDETWRVAYDRWGQPARAGATPETTHEEPAT